MGSSAQRCVSLAAAASTYALASADAAVAVSSSLSESAAPSVTTWRDPPPSHVVPVAVSSHRWALVSLSCHCWTLAPSPMLPPATSTYLPECTARRDQPSPSSSSQSFWLLPPFAGCTITSAPSAAEAPATSSARPVYAMRRSS